MEKISLRNKIKRSLSNEDSIVSAGMIFFIFSMISAFFNYLYQITMGRILGPLEYGILGSLFAFIYIVTYSTSTFNLTFSKFSAEFHGKNEKEKIKYLFKNSLVKIFIIGLICFIVYLILTPTIASFMKLTDYTGIIIVGLIAYISFISVLFTGILNGMQKFIWQNSTSFVSTLIKYFLALLLVLIGFRVNGALTAIFIGILLSLLVSYIPIRKETKNLESRPFELRQMYLYAIPVFFASIMFILIVSIDEILVKHYFSSEQAGIYIAAATIGKIIWFGTSFLIGPLFPKIVSLKARGKDTKKLLINTLVFVGSLAALGCLILFIAPTFITTLLYGVAYKDAAPLVLMFGISLGIFSLIQILMTYDLAIERFKFLYIFLIGIIFEISGIYFFHNSLTDVVKIILATNIFIFAGLLISIETIFFNQKFLVATFKNQKNKT